MNNVIAMTASRSSLAVGDAAPRFTLSASYQDKQPPASLSGKPFVLYFYPKDDTPGCTLEAKDFRDRIKDFERAGVIVLGISKDSTASHAKFQEKYCLPFPLLADESGKTCEAYGVWVEKSMYGKTYMGIERATFLIDANGNIARIWRKVNVDGHVDEVLRAAQAL